MGVTPTSGALTPAYNPLLSPSRAMLFRTTSTADEYTPLSAVCNRTLTRSNGWPTITAQTPPKPPAAKDRSWAKLADATALASSLSSSLVWGTWSFSASFSDSVGAIARMEEAGSRVLELERCGLGCAVKPRRVRLREAKPSRPKSL